MSRLHRFPKGPPRSHKHQTGLATAAACLLSLAATVFAAQTYSVSPCNDTVEINRFPDPDTETDPGFYEGGTCGTLCVVPGGGRLTACVPGRTYRSCAGRLLTIQCLHRGTWTRNLDGVTFRCELDRQANGPITVVTSFGTGGECVPGIPLPPSTLPTPPSQ